MSLEKDISITVAIPVYNGANYIAECIESVLAQEHANFELVVVDNASTDRTCEIVKSYNDERVRLICQDKNIGSIGNFNTCLEVARNEIFILLPHDDKLERGALKAFADSFKRNDILLAFGAVRVIDKHGKQLGIRNDIKKDLLFETSEFLQFFLERFNPIQLAAVNTVTARSLGGFRSEMVSYTDAGLWTAVGADGSIAFINTELSSHRIHDEQGQQLLERNKQEVIEKHGGDDAKMRLAIETSQTLDLEIRLCREILSRLDGSFEIDKIRCASAHFMVKSLLSVARREKSLRDALKVSRFGYRRIVQMCGKRVSNSALMKILCNRVFVSSIRRFGVGMAKW